MPMPQVHFAIGMGASSVLGAGLALARRRRRWLVALPLVMTLGGVVALAPDFLAYAGRSTAPAREGALARRAFTHGPAMNVFFFHPLLDQVPWLDSQDTAALAFNLVALMYLAAACAYAAFIRWRLPRLAETPAVLERMQQEAAGYRPATVLLGIVPLVLLGVGVGWMVRTVPQPRAREFEALQESWARLVERRMRVSPGPYLGWVRTVPEQGEWVVGDLGAHAPSGSGSAAEPTLAEAVERAKAARCGFVVVSDGVEGAGYGPALAAARAEFADVAVLSGLSWEPGGELGPATVLVPPQAGEGALLAGFRRRFEAAGASPKAALRWLKAESRSDLALPAVFSSGSNVGSAAERLFAWSRADECFLGMAGLSGGEQEVGGAWDAMLDAGFQLWGAGAASGSREAARTHVWCRGRGGAAVLDGLRSGCFWAEEGGIVAAVRFEAEAEPLRRPARMGEVVRVAPGTEVRVELELEVPPTDLAGRPNAIDEVDLISNHDGEPQVVRHFTAVRSGEPLRYAVASAEDNHGGVGFFVRARGFRRLGDGSRLAFATNPIRVLVREGAPPPEDAEAPVHWRPIIPQPRTKEPKPESPAGPRTADSSEVLAAMGLPTTVLPLHVETFVSPPGRSWHGNWTQAAGERSPAMGDEGLQVRFVTKIPVGRATRLSFQCYSMECARLTVLLGTTASAKPYQLVRELPERVWTRLDFSLGEDFLAPFGAPGRLGPPAEVLAIEWRGERAGDAAGFYVADLAVYESTRSSRVVAARRRGEQIARELQEANALGAPSLAWSTRADALASRVAQCRARVEPQAAWWAAKDIESVEGELDALAEAVRRLRLQVAMAHAFALPDPSFAVGIEGPTQRVSGRNPACAFGGPLGPVHELWAAAGEAESFQVVVMAIWKPLHAVEVAWTDLRPLQGKGAGLPRSALSASLVGEVLVYPRADLPPDRTGPAPDPLLPFSPFDVGPGELRSVLLTAAVPADLPPGDYEGKVTVRPLGLEPVDLTLRLHRWDFGLSGGHFPVVGPIDERAIRERDGEDEGLTAERRRRLYELLLRHRVDPVPLLTGEEGSDLADLRFCLEQGMGLAVLYQERTALSAGDPRLARAARYAAKLSEAGWPEQSAALLPRAPKGRDLGAYVAAVNDAARRFPGLRLVAGGEDDAPPALMGSYWRRLLGLEPPEEPLPDALEVRRTRSTRREAWELLAGGPGYPGLNLTLVNRLAEARLIPWLAWKHGVRALVLPSVNQWEDNNSGDGLLVYPGADGDFYGSLRLVALRDGVEDYESLWLLYDRASSLRERAPHRHLRILAAVDQLLTQIRLATGSFEHPARDPATLAALRLRMGSVAERLEAAWWAEVDAARDLPQPPAELAAAAGDGLVALSWPKSPDEKATAYTVYRSRDPEVGYVRITPYPVAGLAYTDRTAQNEVACYYFVRAVDPARGEGPRSHAASAKPQPAPKVVWLEMADLTHASVGPYRVALRLEGPLTGTVVPLIRAQIDFCLSDGAYDGFEDMTRRPDKTWVFDVPGAGWAREAGRSLRFKVQLVDRQGLVVTPAVERQEYIDPLVAPH